MSADEDTVPMTAETHDPESTPGQRVVGSGRFVVLHGERVEVGTLEAVDHMAFAKADPVYKPGDTIETSFRIGDFVRIVEPAIVAIDPGEGEVDTTPILDGTGKTILVTFEQETFDMKDGFAVRTGFRRRCLPSTYLELANPPVIP